MASKIERELELSNLIHRPLQVDESASLEADCLKKEVLDRVVILDQAAGGDRWMHRGLGRQACLKAVCCS